MTKNTIAIYNLSIVLVGNFNPSIITPHWLSSKKLIRESDADNAKVKVIHPEISHFSLSFVEIQVTRDKVELTCDNQADFDILRDLAVSMFRSLKETPVKGIGINHLMHYTFKNEKDYNYFGDWLAPKQMWNDILDSPGL